MNENLKTLIISNSTKKVELFRIHVYKDVIRFNETFTIGIEKNNELKEYINLLNDMYKKGRIQFDQIHAYMFNVMYKFGDYLKDYYFQDFELDKNGHFIEAISKTRDELYFEYLQKNKRLHRISKKEFEYNIPNEQIGEDYVEKYIFKGARFYKYRKMHANKPDSIGYYMLVNDKLIISYFVDSID